MAKIDVTKIDGYDSLSAEEKIEKLLAFEIEGDKPDYTGYVKKDVFDRTASELAKMKKDVLDKMTEDEKAKKLAADELEALRNRNAELEKAATVATYKAKYLALGYSDELASANAEAFANGDMETVFANQSKFIEEHDKKVKAGMLGGTKTPPAGGGASITAEQIMAIKDDTERINKIAEHIELFK